MPTDANAPVALFLFAHQDDEFGVFAPIQAALAAKQRVVCMFFTHAGSAERRSIRNQESVSVLCGLGMARDQIVFIGDELGFADGQLHNHAKALGEWLANWVNQTPSIEVCWVAAWEGGHPDHDVLHAATAFAFSSVGKLARVKQYPLYNGEGLPGPLFKVLSPIAANGPVEQHCLPWRQRWQQCLLCLQYPSQWLTWVGLWPFVVLHMLLRTTQQSQPLTLTRLNEPPHPGKLYYERRGFATWQQVQSAVQQMRS
jgi:LmbE family N-acetylglucosaminyl deacetylase